MSEPSSRLSVITGGVAAKTPEPTAWFHDEDYLNALTYLLVYSRETLEKCAAQLTPDDFKPVAGMPDGRPRWLVAERALEYYEKHGEPLGSLVRADVLEYASKISMGANQIAEVREYLKALKTFRPAVPDAIAEKVTRFKIQLRTKSSLLEITEALHAGKLTPEKWEEFFHRGLSAGAAKPDPMEGLAQWPEPLKQEALYGLAGDVVRAIEPRCEADPAAVLLETLAAFGNVIGRAPYWMHGATRHALNLFVGIVGGTGTGKGSGLDQVMDVFRDVDTSWSRNPNIYAGLSSGEGFIKMVRDPSEPRRDKNGNLTITDPGVEDKRLLIIQPEFAQVLEVMERSGNTLCAKLRNAWDGKPMGNNSLSSHYTATNAHISMIVQSTPEDLRDLMSRTMILNGTGNRFLWVASQRSKTLPFGGAVPAAERSELVERLRAAMKFAAGLKKSSEGRGRLFFDGAAKKLWVSVYNTTLMRQSENPVTGRAAPQVRRMASIYALLDCADRVAEVHLTAALETWRYCAEGAWFIFGGVHRTDPDAIKVLEALRAAKTKSLTRREITSGVFQNNKTAEEITRIRETLRKQGKIRYRTDAAAAGPGRPAERWSIATG